MKITKKTGIIALVLVAAIALMGFGFAAWTATLTAEGTVASNAKWDIEFIKASATDLDKVSASDATVQPKAIDFGKIEFTQPLGWIEYTVQVENKGTVDAVLTTENFVPTSNDAGSGWTYDIVDFSGETIKAGEVCEFTIVLQAKDVDSEDADAFDVSGSFELTLVYEAASVTDAPAAVHNH